MSNHLVHKKTVTTIYRFLFEGLEHFTESLLISGSSNIELANEFGIKKMLRNIAALRQGFISLAQAAFPFRRADNYYKLYFLGPVVLNLLESINKSLLSSL